MKNIVISSLFTIVVLSSCNWSANPFNYQNRIDRYLSKGDLNKACEVLQDMSTSESANEWFDTDFLGGSWKLKDSDFSIAEEKVIYALCSNLMTDEEATDDMIINALRQWKHPTHRIGNNIKQDYEFEHQQDYYNRSAMRYNSLIKNVIDQALLFQKSKLANTLVLMIKPTLRCTMVDSNWFSADIVNYEYDYSSKQEMEAKVLKKN